MMMDDRQSMSLSFPIKDTFFISQNDSEIQEIDEIELTPQIQIKEGDGEVSVSGYLLLKGKYVAKPESNLPSFFEDDETAKNSFSDAVRFSPFQIQQSDFLKEPPLVTFEHKIPIHVQIARSRIENLKHIFASIDSFDYDIESSRKLAITADLILNGMKPGTNKREESVDIPHAYQYISSQNLDESPFSLERPLEEETKSEEEMDTSPISNPFEQYSAFRDYDSQSFTDPIQLNKLASQDEPHTEEYRESRNDIESQEVAEPSENTATYTNDDFREFDGVQRKEETRESMIDSSIEAEEPIEEPIEEPQIEKRARVSISGKGTKLEPVTINEHQGIRKEIKTTDNESERNENATESLQNEKEGALYLTSFLRSSEENFTRLKMCILQKDETLDTIAERYRLSPDELVRANENISGSSFNAGQVIYIPVNTKK